MLIKEGFLKFTLVWIYVWTADSTVKNFEMHCGNEIDVEKDKGTVTVNNPIKRRQAADRSAVSCVLVLFHYHFE